jgi:hypothetical protein
VVVVVAVVVVDADVGGTGSAPLLSFFRWPPSPQAAVTSAAVTTATTTIFLTNASW